MPIVKKIMANVFGTMCLLWISSTVVTLQLLSVTVVHLRAYDRPLSKSLACYANTSSFCMVTPISLLPTRLVPQYGSTCGRLWTTLPTVPFSCRVSLIAWTHHEAPGRHMICNRRWHATSWHLLATDTWHQFLLCQDISLGATAGQMFKCQWRLCGLMSTIF
jgi:hypothetical protein